MTIRPEVVDFIKTAIELKNKGLITAPDQTLAEAAGVSKNIIHNLRKHGGTVSPKVKQKNTYAAPGRPCLPDYVRKGVVRDYIANELTYEEMAKKHKVSKSTVYRWGQEELGREVA